MPVAPSQDKKQLLVGVFLSSVKGIKIKLSQEEHLHGSLTDELRLVSRVDASLTF